MIDVVRVHTRLRVVLNRFPTATWKIVSLSSKVQGNQKATYNCRNVWEKSSSPMAGRLDGSLRRSLCTINHRPASNHSDGTNSGSVSTILSYNVVKFSSSPSHGGRPVIIS